MSSRFALVLLLPFVVCAQTPVKIAPYYTPGVGTQSLTTAATTDTSIDVLAAGPGGPIISCASSLNCGGQRTLMPRAGQVTRIAIYLGDTSNLQTLYFSSNTCAAYSSPACLTFTPSYTAAITGPFTASAVNTFTLATPLSVNKGDALAVRAEWSTPHGASLALFSSQLIGAQTGHGPNSQPEACNYQLNAAKQSTFTLASMTLIPNAGCPVIGAYMTPPMVVGIGDSIFAGAPSPGDSVADYPPQAYPIPATFPPVHFWAAGYAGAPITYQSMGRSGETAVQIQARFSTHALALNPRYVLIEGGVNDLSGCDINAGCTGARSRRLRRRLPR